MKIAGFQYNLSRKTLEIYLSGCSGPCLDCHNKELWDFNVGDNWETKKEYIEKRIKNNMVNAIWILGGEPLEQSNEDLLELIDFIKQYNIELWLWTRFEKDQVPDEIINKIDYLKTGYYNPNLRPYVDPLSGIKLASSNQKIYKICY